MFDGAFIQDVFDTVLRICILLFGVADSPLPVLFLHH